MITVSNLVKRFAGDIALDDVSFSVKRSEIVGIVGPNGAGKTTLMRILAGYLLPTEGTVKIDGMDVASQSLEVRRRIGYLPEAVSLYPEMRVNEFLLFRARLKGVLRRKCKKRLEEVVALCGLQAVTQRIIGQLSRGYWQRIGLADSLIRHPELLILDEPTIRLDPNQIRDIRQLLKNLGSGYTILLSTHFLSEAEMLCKRILILNHGKIVASDSPQELLALLQGATRLIAEIYGPSQEVSRKLAALPDILHVSCKPCNDSHSQENSSPQWCRYILESQKNADFRATVFDTVRNNKWTLRELSQEKKHLEDVFVEMTIEGNKR